MIKKRLLTLAKFLLTVPEDNFDLSTWRAGDCSGFVTDEKLNNHTCGTTACAVGWACSIPEFINLGLHMPLHRVSAWSSYPVFSGQVSWDAVEKFFGITQEESKYLFQSDYYYGTSEATPSGVAIRIKQFVKLGHIP